ncbi:MAG: hypothetical protein H6541_10075 [Lentimicrobiaceae bacterium]|nr:hypothetical protein [Lentimicrobiaceae bacterium]
MDTSNKTRQTNHQTTTHQHRFSWFKSQYDKTPSGAITLNQLFDIITKPETGGETILKAATIVDEIRAGKVDKTEKSKLPVFTASAVISRNEGAFTPDRIVEYSGFTQLDIDPKGNPGLLTSQADAEILRDTLAGLPFVKIAALSASGKGVWLLVGVPDGKLKPYFLAYLNYFEYLGIKLDASKGTRPNQFRYYAPDRGAILNDICQPIALPKEQEPKQLINTIKPQFINTELSPIADYNKRGDIVAELKRFGWIVINENGNKIRLKSAAGQHKFNSEYDRQKNYFFVWTDHDTPFKADTGYTPASTWAILNNIDPDNPAELNKALRENGYGNRQTADGFFKRITAQEQQPQQIHPQQLESAPQATAEANTWALIEQQFRAMGDEINLFMNPGKTEAQILYDLEILSQDLANRYGKHLTPDEYYKALKWRESQLSNVV